MNNGYSFAALGAAVRRVQHCNVRDGIVWSALRRRSGLVLASLAILCASWPVAIDAGVPGQERGEALQLIVSARVPAEDTPQAIEIPVDSTVSRLDVTVQALPGIEVKVVRPGGTYALPTDGDVRHSALRIMDLDREVPANLALYVITRPASGTWQVIIGAAGEARGSSVHVEGRGSSPIGFATFEFVHKQEGVHGGYFRNDGLPLAGVPATARAALPGAPSRAAFRLIDAAARPLHPVTLRTGDPNVVPGDFVGTFDLPGVPFRIVMRAVDETGAPVQRQYPTTFRAQPVAVFVGLGGSDVIQPGKPRRLTCAVANVGSQPATFTLAVRSSVGMVSELSPATLTVPAQSSATASFSLTVPSTVERTRSVELRVTATSTIDPTVKNNTSVDLELARPGDADGDYVDDADDNCRDVVNPRQTDMNRNGIGDACEAGEPLSIKSVSPAAGPPGTVLTIKGAGFSADGPSFVLFNGIPASASRVDATEITVTVPPETVAGPVPLVIMSGEAFAVGAMPFIVRAAGSPTAARQ